MIDPRWRISDSMKVVLLVAGGLAYGRFAHGPFTVGSMQIAATASALLGVSVGRIAGRYFKRVFSGLMSIYLLAMPLGSFALTTTGLLPSSQPFVFLMNLPLLFFLGMWIAEVSLRHAAPRRPADAPPPPDAP